MGERTYKMKIISQTIIAACLAANLMIQNVDQVQCGDEMCGTAHGRYAASQVCMAVDESVVAYYGAGVGEIGEERCMCIYSFRWNQKQGRNFPVVPSKTPECAVAYLTQELNVVEDESSATLATKILANYAISPCLKHAKTPFVHHYSYYYVYLS